LSAMRAPFTLLPTSISYVERGNKRREDTITGL
jgi:hypothetical protein